MSTVEETLSLIRDDIKKCTDKNQAQLKEMSDKNEAQLKEISNKLDDYAKKVDKFEKRMADIEEQQLFFYEGFDDIKGELNKIKQKEISLNLIIKGISESENETTEELQEMMRQLMTVIGVQDIGELKSVRRIGNKDPKKHRLVFLETYTLEQKKRIIEHKRKHKITANQIVINNKPLGDTTTNIYIDEQLTKYTARLLSRCRQLKSEINIKYIWTSNGIIYMRIDDNTPVIMIQNDTDIEIFRVKYSKIAGRKRKADTYANGSDSELQVQKPKKRQYGPRTTVTRSASINSRFMEAREAFMTDDVMETTPTPIIPSTQANAIVTRNGGRGRGAAVES